MSCGCSSACRVVRCRVLAAQHQLSGLGVEILGLAFTLTQRPAHACLQQLGCPDTAVDMKS